MTELATLRKDLLINVRTLGSYSHGSPQERRFHHDRIKNGKVFIAMRNGNEWLFAPSRFAGYKNNSITRSNQSADKDGKITNPQITKILGKYIDPKNSLYAAVDAEFLNYCARFSIIPSTHKTQRRYWVEDDLGANELPLQSPDELPDNDDIWEGAKQVVVVNRFERDPAARRACLDYHKPKCQVCELTFEERYGGLGMGFIHVHHIVPISTIGKRYKVDPINDLRPVCPNCHAMLHFGSDKLLSIEELKKMLRPRSRHR